MSDQKSASPSAAAPPAAMLRIVQGFWLSRAVYVAAKLGLADLVADQPKTAAELAASTKTHGPSLYRVLRALASEGLFAEDAQGRFALTPLAATLQTNVPVSLRAFAMTELGEEHYPAWGEVLHSVKTGETAFDYRFGMSPWEFFAKNPENAKIFNDAMTNVTAVVDQAILAGYDFSGIQRLVDVGSGHGTLMVSILKANPGMNGVVFDAPHVVDGARRRIEAEGLASRCKIVAGDFFESVPADGDGYLLKWIIHDWDDERSISILRNCRRSMMKQGRLLLVEAVIPPGNQPFFPKFMDLNMLVMTGGRERTEADYRALFEAAGFRLTRTVPTESAFCVIEGAAA